MLSTKNNPLQFILGCALTFVTILYFYREAIHAEQLEHAERATTVLPSTFAGEESDAKTPGDSQRASPIAQGSGKEHTPKASERARDLILYSFHETEGAARNFAFFRKHALHAKADFIFMINGKHTQDLTSLAALPNVRIIERENRCFDLGGYKEIFDNNSTLVTAYKRFMFINDSLRGPFLPPWANHICWSDAYWDKLDESTRVVGMTWNCANGTPHPPHLQSMILAFSRDTLQRLLLPHMLCYADMHSAVADGETAIARRILAAGYDVAAMEGRFAAHAGASRKNSSAFLDWCVDTLATAGRGGNDILHTGKYQGSSLHPYETLFAKTNRGWDERDGNVIDLLTEQADLTGSSSYDSCV